MSPVNHKGLYQGYSEEAFHLVIDERERERGGERERELLRSIRTYWVHQFPPTTPLPPEPNPIFGPHCQAESRWIIKSLILVGTIITSVALVRHVFRYLSSSSVTTGT